MSWPRCFTCGSWQKRALDFGYCWSGDRLDDNFAEGPAAWTHRNDVCEAWWAGTFNAAEIIAAGGDPASGFLFLEPES